MTTSDSDGAPPTPAVTPGLTEGAAPKRARRRPVARPTGPAPRMVERLTDEPPMSAGTTAAADAVAADAAGADAQPDIDEDGAWIEADAVEIHQGAVGRVDATEVSVTQGAIGTVKGERIDVKMGAVGAALGGHVTVAQGLAGTVLTRQANVEQALVRTLIARDVTITRPSAVVFLVAQRVSGEVKVLMDWRGALAFGAAFGILAGLFGRGRKRG